MNLLNEYKNLNKWLCRRRGRLSQLARMLGIKRQTLHSMIFTYKVDNTLMSEIRKTMELIEVEEKQAVRVHKRLKSWMQRGSGRQKALAAYLKTSTVSLRKMRNAKGDSRYVVLRYGVKNLKSGMIYVEQEVNAGFHKHILIKDELESQIRNKYFSLNELESVLRRVRSHANYGLMGACLVYQKLGSKYRIISLGFDSRHDGMLKSHLCERDNPTPYVHSAAMARLNLSSGNAAAEIGEVGTLVDDIPCQYCLNGLLRYGLSEVIYTKTPVNETSLNLLLEKGITPLKADFV
jgi:DNA-binding Xre family transcriptional regulator/deoxycytidylate deaminase